MKINTSSTNRLPLTLCRINISWYPRGSGRDSHSAADWANSSPVALRKSGYSQGPAWLPRLAQFALRDEESCFMWAQERSSFDASHLLDHSVPLILMV